MMVYTEIESIEQFRGLMPLINEFEYYAFQNIDFTEIEDLLKKFSFKKCLFLGCKLNNDDIIKLYLQNDLFQNMDMPYNQFPSELYRPSLLYDNYVVGEPKSYELTYDYKIYRHFIENGKEADTIKETFGRKLHDHSITDALYDFLENYEDRKVVAIMGGHNLSRKQEQYRKIALLSKKLCENGYLMVSGGGPGSMEATHLGAWFANRTENELDSALKILSKAPQYNHPLWLDSAFEVIEKYPRITEFESLGIPTWLYGHEPATPFATKIAKYFANSIREDGLLTIAKGGLIFAPGSAGTLQEIFQDATQNHYKIFGYSSPMIFFDKNFWLNKIPVYTFLEQLLNKNIYKNLLLSIFDSADELLNELLKFAESSE